MHRLVFFALCFVGLFAQAVTAGDRVIVRGDMGYEPLRLKNLSDGTDIDLDGATFRVAISKNTAPTEGQSCESGDLPVNRYPFAIEFSPEVRISNGLFDGEAPEASDWLHTYCNSAAVRLEESPEPVVRELRMNLVWDGIRFDLGSEDFDVSRVWMSDVRDDCFENDHLMNGSIRDSLLDGCFAGLSVAPINETRNRPTVKLERVLMRMQQYPYRGKMGHAMPIKIKEKGARVTVKDSIFAVDTENLIGGKHADVMWQAITKCSGNQLLWLGEGDLPEIYSKVPKCFEVVTGPKAHDIWEQARQNWIAENPGVPRFPSERDS